MICKRQRENGQATCSLTPAMTRGGRPGWRIPSAWLSILFPGLPIRGGVPFVLEGELVVICSGGVRGPSPGALPSLLEETPISLNDFTRESMDALLESVEGEGPGLVACSEGNLLGGERLTSPMFSSPLCEIGGVGDGGGSVRPETVPLEVGGLCAGEGRHSCDPARDISSREEASAMSSRPWRAGGGPGVCFPTMWWWWTRGEGAAG